MVVLAHHRRRIVHFNVTANPTAVWTAQQVVEAFPEESAPRFLIRDRDQIYGKEFCQRVKGMGIEEVITAARSPWQNPYAERVIGSIRRECLDHLIVLNEAHPRRILRQYFAHGHTYHWSETLQRQEKSTILQRAKSSPFHKSEAYIIGIDEPHNFGALSVLAIILLGSIKEVLLRRSSRESVQTGHQPGKIQIATSK
jgi:hypothetical protein